MKAALLLLMKVGGQVVMNKVQLVKDAILLDIEIKEKTKCLNEIKAKLQSEGLFEMENKNLKFLQYFAEDGSCELSYKKKFEIENYKLLREVFDEVLDSKVTRVETVKYEVESKFKDALIALYSNEYKDHDLGLILKNLGLDDKQIKAVSKKLKGKYIQDKQLLEEFNVRDDSLEEELDMIREKKNYDLITRYCDLESVDLEKLRKAIYVEDSLAIGLTYQRG